MRYCADTQQHIVGVLPIPAGRSQAGTAFLTIMSQRKKGCESLTYPFPGFNFYQRQYTCQDNVSRLVLDSVEAWLSGLKRQFAKLVKSFYRFSQVRILLLPLRVAQSTLLSVDLGLDGQRQTVRSSPYFRWGCYGSTPQAVIVRNDVKLHITHSESSYNG